MAIMATKKLIMESSILQRGAEIGGQLGIKGILAIAGLTVGCCGLAYGVRTSRIVHALSESINNIKGAEKVDLTPLKKVDDIYDVVKQMATDEQFNNLVSELDAIKGKINDINVIYDEAKSTAGLEDFIKAQDIFKDELTQSQMDIAQQVEKFTGTMSRKFDHFTGEIQDLLDSIKNELNELKNTVSESKEEILNNQSDILDINNSLYELTGKIECLINKAKREIVSAPQVEEITQSNLVDVDSFDQSNLVNVDSFDQSNLINVEFGSSELIEFTEVDLFKDDTTGQLNAGTIETDENSSPKLIKGELDSVKYSTEFNSNESGDVFLKPIKPKLEHRLIETEEHSPHVYSSAVIKDFNLVEVDEDTGSEVISGHGEITAYLDDGKSVLVIKEPL